ncbi:hypothetical protein EYZ11_008275 [Aspergillus tanneri]|uniref:Required for respiratory growth protein 9, mitochondrial n=1 Tax=Aspergillus tanneri TaxID=1220188 RepID=A0A4S3JAT4_9EURO|nr:hypothetical protein EYZ11_008275 [Aspergillus tanneri]
MFFAQSSAASHILSTQAGDRRSSSTATDAPVAQLHKETESWEDDSQTPEAKIGSVKSSKGVDSAEGQKPALDSSHAKKRLDTGRIYTQSKPKRKREKWQVQKEALKEKFTEGWNPPKKLSPDALEGIRHLHAIAPDRFTTPVLAEQFQVSPEAIRRILKSKWRPSEEELENRRKRWEKRHDRIWSHLTELGLRPKTRRTKPLADNKMLYNKRDKGRKS